MQECTLHSTRGPGTGTGGRGSVDAGAWIHQDYTQEQGTDVVQVNMRLYTRTGHRCCSGEYKAGALDGDQAMRR